MPAMSAALVGFWILLGVGLGLGLGLLTRIARSLEDLHVTLHWSDDDDGDGEEIEVEHGPPKAKPASEKAVFS